MKKAPLQTILGIGACCFLISPSAITAATEAGAETGKPAVADDRFKELLENSPFLRPLDLSRSLIVTGLADVEGETLATIFDREDDSTTLVTDISGNERGMKIEGVRRDRRSKRVALKISVRGAEIEIPFDADALLPRPDNTPKPAGDKGGGKGSSGKGGRDLQAAPETHHG